MAPEHDTSADPLSWPTGRESGRQTIALGFALVLTAVSVDLVLSGSLSLFFDLTFTASCLLLAWQVRPADFFTVGVLPPLLMLGVFVFIGFVEPGLIARPADGVLQAVISGLSGHAGALIIGYILVLGSLFYRVRSANRRVEDLL